MFRKHSRLVFAVLALTLMVLGTSVQAQEPTRVVFWQFFTEPNIIAAYETAIADFEAANPDIDVVMEIVPWSEQQQRLTTALSAGGMPDVSMLGNNVVAQYQALGALTPLTDYLAAWSEDVGSDVTEDFWPGDYGYYLIDGDWWGSPMNVETRALWYREDLLQAAGFDSPPSTWDELREMAVALTNDDVYGFGIPGAIDYPTLQVFMNVYLGYGARFLNDEGMCGFDTPEFREALAYYTDLYLVNEVSPPDTPIFSREQLVQLLADGRLAMYIDGPWILGTILDAEPEWIDSLKVALIPEGPAGRFGFLGGWPLVLWDASENKDAAWEWIKYATDPEGGLPGIAASANLPPGRQSIAQGWLDGADEAWRDEFLTFLDGLAFAQPYQYPDAEIPQMATLEVDAIQTAVQNVMLGTETVDEAAVSLCERIDEVLSR
jgi:ABC-type glycerol-3-phosphate transport system substrate-binding protein